jgi:formamidopyrimidine-DNA glycosylase
MPELPDVEIFRSYFDSTSLHQEIVDIEFDTAAERILEDITVDQLKDELVGHQCEETRRHGKYFFARLDNQKWLMLHFGMTGYFQYYKNEDEKPSHSRLILDFANDYHLAFSNTRKLGKVKMMDDDESYISEKGLGPDVLSDDFDFEKFTEVLAGRRGMIKSALMNQDIMAGIGNIYSDEILFQAKIHPKTSVNALSEKDLKQIFEATQAVMKTAIEKNVDTSQFPDSYIIPHREEGESCPRCDGEVKNIKVSGRSGYYCPSCQEKR